MPNIPSTSPGPLLCPTEGPLYPLPTAPLGTPSLHSKDARGRFSWCSPALRECWGDCGERWGGPRPRKVGLRGERNRGGTAGDAVGNSRQEPRPGRKAGGETHPAPRRARPHPSHHREPVRRGADGPSRCRDWADTAPTRPAGGARCRPAPWASGGRGEPGGGRAAGRAMLPAALRRWLRRPKVRPGGGALGPPSLPPGPEEPPDGPRRGDPGAPGIPGSRGAAGVPRGGAGGGSGGDSGGLFPVFTATHGSVPKLP